MSLRKLTDISVERSAVKFNIRAVREVRRKIGNHPPNPVTSIPRGLNLQQHRCEKLKSRIIAIRPCTQTFLCSPYWYGLSGYTCISNFGRETNWPWDKSAGAWSWLVLSARSRRARVCLSSRPLYTAWCRNKHRENVCFIALPFALHHSGITLFSVCPLPIDSEINCQNRTFPVM